MGTVLDKIFQQVKSDFCSLINFKLRGNVIEIITNICTINNQYVSVFISQKDDYFVVSDGGWISSGLYEDEINQNDENIISTLELQYLEHFKIKTTTNRAGIRYNYKTTGNFDLISSLVFDVGNYVVSIINSRAVIYSEPRQQNERQKFHSDVSRFLKDTYSGYVRINSSITGYNEQLSGIKFNAVIRTNSKTHLIMYVTGSTSNYFQKDASEAYMNFEMASRYSRGVDFNKIALVNTHANGYSSLDSPHLQFIREQGNGKVLGFFDVQEQIRDYIPLAN